MLDKTIFVYGAGSGLTPASLKYIAGLTQKPKPRICYVPTATGDNIAGINHFNSKCEGLNIEPHILYTFISSEPGQQSFEDILMSMDAIIVGGGNTLNMIAIWKAHGIDIILRKAYDKGTILAGGSAGSLCWFNAGYSDSRPKALSIVEGLGFLPYSNCVHYNGEPERKPLYHHAILTGELQAGYACDDQAGLVFVNGVVYKSVSHNKDNNNYFVSLAEGTIKEELLPAEILE